MARRTLWQIPSLHTEAESGQHRKVTWLELFFDLFFVVGVSQLSYTLLGRVPAYVWFRVQARQVDAGAGMQEP